MLPVRCLHVTGKDHFDVKRPAAIVVAYGGGLWQRFMVGTR